MKHQLFAGIAFLAAAAMPIGVAQAQAVENGAEESARQTQTYDLGAGDLDTSLDRFAEQNGFQIGYPPDLVAGKSAPALQGEFSATQALERLLAGSGLEAEFVNDRAIVLRRIPAAADTTGQRRPGIEEIIVTGQKREERIQDVPIAISAFTAEDLHAQKIEGGFDLLKGVPNVTFTKTNFTSYNFSIRGIGTQAVSATTDPGVAVSFNNTTLIVNRLFEQEYVDVERVEVLRGPQGTLFGRNATAGVINVISNKPELGVWGGELKVEVGNFNARRLRGMFNVPIGDTFAIRGAYASTERDGFGTNQAANDPNVLTDVREDVDGRDLWTGRLSLGWQPTDRFRANLLWERFEEDDNRVRTSKQLCHHDPGPRIIGDFDFADEVPTIIAGVPFFFPEAQATFRGTTSQGCLPGSLYADEAFGTPNGASLPYIVSVNFAAGLAGIGRTAVDGKLMGHNPFVHDPDSPPAPCPLAASATFSSVVWPLDKCSPDPYGGRTQSRDLRTIHSTIEPIYEAEADIFEFSVDIDLTDSLTFSSQTVYTKDAVLASQDFNRFSTVPIFNDSLTACGEKIVLSGKAEIDCSDDPDTGRGTISDGFYRDLLPGGVFTDPQIGPSKSLLGQDLSQSTSRQFNQEFRLVSGFDGPVNFSLGGSFTRFETINDYFVFINALTLFTHFFPFVTPTINCDFDFVAQNGLSYVSGEQAIHNSSCVYVDPTPLADIADGQGGDGHNYFRSANPYELASSALFGELYWQATDTVKVTLGARMTWDRKVFTPVPSQLLLRDFRWYVPDGAGPEQCTLGSEFCPLAGTGTGGRGSVPLPDIVQEWREPTGRIIVDWKPDLGFTDETMAYVSIARGYKGGGANPPNIAPPAGIFNAVNSGVAAPPTFEPEFINAFEVGTKNTLFGGVATLNLTGFYYDYKDYQVSKIVDRSASNENFDATVWGLEFEGIFAPSLNWQFNAALGYLNTRIADGERSIDLMDRTQGGGAGSYIDIDGVEQALAFDEWMVVKPFISNSSNCVIPVEVAEDALTRGIGFNALFGGGLCPGGGLGSTGTAGTYTLADDRTYLPGPDSPNGGAGFFAELDGHELPNAPEFTLSLGGQYNFDLTHDWQATARVDYYWQDESFARVYNTEYDRLKSWSNTNLSFWVANPQWGVTVEAYVKNVFDETPITGTFLNSDDSGLTTNVFTLDPRLIGVSIRKEF